MKAVPAPYIAWSLWTASMGLVTLVLLVEHLFVPSIAQQPFLADVAIIVAFAAMATTGALVGSRNPRNPIGWLLLLGPAAAALAELAFIYAQYTIHVRPGVLPAGELVGLVSLPLWFVFFAQLPFLMLLFPGGTLLSAHWRWVAWGFIGAIAVAMVSSLLVPELEVQPSVDNPIAITGAEALSATAFVAIALLLAAAIVSLVLRFIRSTGVERQQIKWFAYTAGVYGTYTIISVLLELTGNGLPNTLDAVLFGGFLSLLPVGVAVAILKYRLYDIDILINRTVVYGPLTGILMGLYIASIRLFQAVFVRVLGDESNFAILLSTLMLAGAFMPVRLRLQALADRYFKESPDPIKALRAFGDQVQAIVHLSDISQMTRRLLDEAVGAFRAESGAVFLQQGGELRLAQTFGAWDGNAHLTVPLEHGSIQVGQIALGARRHNQAYSDDERRTLQEIAGVAARVLAIAQGRS